MMQSPSSSPIWAVTFSLFAFKFNRNDVGTDSSRFWIQPQAHGYEGNQLIIFGIQSFISKSYRAVAFMNRC
jgi:hypothetical protein